MKDALGKMLYSNRVKVAKKNGREVRLICVVYLGY